MPRTAVPPKKMAARTMVATPAMQRLLEYSFEWVLPGHGRPIRLTREQMRVSLERCVEWMASGGRAL